MKVYYLEVISYGTGEVVERFDVTGQTERQIDKLDNGVNANLNHEEYYTTVSTYETEQPKK